MIRSSVLTMTLVLFSVTYAPTLLAETDAEQSAPADQFAPSEPAMSAPSYSDQELHSFAVALLEVERIKSAYAPKLAQNLREQAQVKQAASLELLLALKQQGMSVDKYQEMLASVQSNPDLAGKVNEYLKKSASERDPGDDADSPRAQSAKPKGRTGSDASQKVEEL
ncbi:MAG TPA: DUF4168 domain-containing protein [Casimicrobiaceae bacterium]|nr:DUF4168 domain-containing protein [Casimicrobiaceae bacterium]